MSEASTDRLLFLGDAFLPEDYASSINGVDNVVFNLEHPITVCRSPAQGKVVLKSDIEHITSTFQGTPRVACLANNHIMDYGKRGLYDTLDVLNNLGIEHYGAGMLSDSCNNPLFLELDGTIVALAGYVCRSSHPTYAEGNKPGVAPIDIERIRRDVQAARAGGAERVLVSLHWGIEEVFLPRPEDVDTARSIMDLGVDLIIGHHAHRIQPFHRLSHGYVFYGLGNFILPDVNLPSHFDAEGRPTSRCIKSQACWNRWSLAISYRPSDGHVELSTLYFDGRCVKSRESGVLEGLELDSTAPWLYDARFQLSRFTGTLISRAWSYYNNPRIPSFLRGKLKGILP